MTAPTSLTEINPAAKATLNRSVEALHAAGYTIAWPEAWHSTPYVYARPRGSDAWLHLRVHVEPTDSKLHRYLTRQHPSDAPPADTRP